MSTEGEALDSMSTSALRAPTPSGEKLTPKVQVATALTVPLQLSLAMANWAASAPASDRSLMVSSALPSLLIVTVDGALVACDSTWPKSIRSSDRPAEAKLDTPEAVSKVPLTPVELVIATRPP